MDIELLSVSRAARFIEYSMQHDLQVKVNRSTAASLLSSSIARPRETEVMEFGSEKFDKIQTFLNSNDQQVHYATAANSVGVYAITRLLGELRRQIRDHLPDNGDEGVHLNMMSPRNPVRSGPGTARGGLSLGSGFGLISAQELAHRATLPHKGKEVKSQQIEQEGDASESGA